MNTKIVKSLTYFIFSAVLVSTTAFFINENYSLRIYINTLTYTTLNYLWVVIMFTQFIYIYRSGRVGLGNIYLITIISIILFLLVNTLFDPFDYTSLSKNSIKEIFINRSNLEGYRFTNNIYFLETITKIKIFNPRVIYFLVNPSLLYYVNNRTDNSSTILSLVFIIEILVLIYLGHLLYLEFYILLIILLLKFGGSNEAT